MGDNEKDNGEFDRVWETAREEWATEEFGQTRTMKPISRTHLPSSQVRAATEKLPVIDSSEVDGGIPDVKIVERLGRGGTAEVFAASQHSIGRRVAVKKRRPDRDKNETESALLQEAWITGRLQHPNIVPIYRLGRDNDDEPIIVMKEIEGVSWKELLDDPTKAPGRYEFEEPIDLHLDILTEVCDAIEYAHSRSIIHRDLKPENVMIGAFGEVYVLDWGLGVGLPPDAPENLPRADKIREPAGTPVYMAPEMAEGDGRQLGPHTDIYLLGALLHEVLTGEAPHEADSLRQIMANAFLGEVPEYGEDVPPHLAEVCRRAMARPPEQRYESVEAFRRDVAEFKRYRRSRELSQHAHERLGEFRDSFESVGHSENGDGELHELFGECRFGFERALEVDPDNDEAREGLQEAMEQMIERELDEGGFHSASMLLSELPETNESLEQRVAELRERRQDREREFEKLKEFETEQDVDLGRKTRSIFAFVLGLILGAVSYAPVVLPGVGIDFQTESVGMQGLVIGAVIAAGLYLGRDSLFRNSVNRQFVASLVCVIGCIAFLRSYTDVAGLPDESLLIIENAVAAGAAGIIGVCVDRRLFWAAVPYFLGAVVAAQWTSHAYLANSLSDVIALSLLGLAWWPRD